MKYYAIRVGKVPGIYTNWDEAKVQVTGYPGAKYKGFTNEKDALEFMGDVMINKATPNRNNEIEKPVKKVKKTVKKLAEKSIYPSQNLSDEGTFVFTDGSCINYFGGYGVVIIENGNCTCKISGSVPVEKATNNIAELYAIKVALINTIGDITIYTDSQYSMGVLTKTMKATKNLELIGDIQKIMFGRCITFLHVLAHNGDEYNELADKLADEGRLE